jgi:hypothetical protein
MLDHTGTGAGLIAFLDYTAAKGLMNGGTAKAYRVACREVLSTVEEDWESADIQRVNVEDLLARFEVKASMKYTPKSLMTYRSRFRSAVSMYRGFLVDPGGWRPPKQQPSRNTGSSMNRPGRPTATTSVVTDPQAPSIAHPSPAPTMQQYPFPLSREGNVVFAMLVVPVDLTRREAERIGAHLLTLVVDEQQALPHPPTPNDGG